jgi:two-component system, LytTR family, response regulator
MFPPPEPLRVIIADDEPRARRRLRPLHAQETDNGIVVEAEYGLDTIDAVRDHPADLLFLDVRMPGADGIEVLEAIGPGGVGAVVLVTAFDDYAVAAFEHHALDYVLKPVDEDRFRATLERVREQLFQQRAARLTEAALQTIVEACRRGDPEQKYLTRIVLRETHKRTVVQVADIDWIEASGDYLALHIGKQVYLHRATLSGLEERLNPADFLRIHRSTLVRISRVKHVEPYFHGDSFVTLRDGTRLRLSRSYRAKVQAALDQTGE